MLASSIEELLSRLNVGRRFLPIVRATDFAYVVNMEVAKKLGRYPPFAFLQVAEAVNN